MVMVKKDNVSCHTSLLYMWYKEDVAVKKQKALLVQLTYFLPIKSLWCTTLEAQHHAKMHVCQMTDARFDAGRTKVSVYCTRHKLITFTEK